MTITVTLIPGDGIGPEIADAMKAVVAASGADVAWEEAQAGEACIATYGTPLPAETLEAVKRNRVAIKGPITTPVGTGFRSVNVALRQELGLNVCLRPVESFPGSGGRYTDVDVVIVRENSEDLYAGIEFEQGSEGAAALIDLVAAQGAGKIRPDSGISVKPISITQSKAIVRYAFEYALAHGRKKVTAVHKANIMKYSDGLFLRCAREVAAEYEGRMAFDERIVDAFCMNMVMDPTQFDVVVFPNLYGDIASDLCAGMVGGLGLAPGANIGPDYAVFEATHGSAPKYAGLGVANPTALIMSAVMMLEHIGQTDAAARIRRAVREVYEEGEVLTRDIRYPDGSRHSSTTKEFTDRLIRAIEEQ